MRNSKAIIRIIGLLSVLLVLASCKKEVAKEKEDAVIPVASTEAVVSNKWNYENTENFNSFVLTFEREGDSVKGNFEYHLQGRDQNSGTIAGVFVGDLLIVDYVYHPKNHDHDHGHEGDNIRQIVFKLDSNDGSLTEGYGDTVEKAGKVVFKDVNQLNYNSKFKLKPVK